MLYVKYHKFIKSQDNWRIFWTIMLEMHLEKYVCLHVALLLLLCYDFNRNWNIKKSRNTTKFHYSDPQVA